MTIKKVSLAKSEQVALELVLALDPYWRNCLNIASNWTVSQGNELQQEFQAWKTHTLDIFLLPLQMEWSSRVGQMLGFQIY